MPIGLAARAPVSDHGQTGGIFELGVGRVGLTVDPAYGARVMSLTDRAMGRQWLLEGPRTDDTSDSAAYLGEASRGGDECFPTILPCHHAAWGTRLRDHGLLWGRHGRSSRRMIDNSSTLSGEGIVFSRRLTLVGAVVTASYTVTSEREGPFPICGASIAS
jgi:hypothetical protein